jgi:hypothetical protein
MSCIGVFAAATTWSGSNSNFLTSFAAGPLHARIKGFEEGAALAGDALHP